MRRLCGILTALLLSLTLLTTGAATALADGGDGSGGSSRAAQQAVTPKAPQFDDEDYTFRIPTTRGVDYLVEGDVLEAGWWDWFGTVTVTARATAGYTLSGTTQWTHTFISHPFIDVPRGSEHEEAIDFMYWAGLSTGWDTRRGPEFRPLAPVNRDAMAAFLYRLEGEPRVKLPSRSPFTDVSPSSEHYRAIIWAYEEGITTGWTSANGTRQFRPTQPIARDAMAAFLYRFDGSPRTAAPSASCFRDVRPSQQFAKEMCWMKSEGISTGWSDGTYRPLQSVKRDAMAAFLYRYVWADDWDI